MIETSPSSFREFDPYYKWLGIPPEEQPLTHYRLLGIKDFENDPDVIASAADRQMAHVRTFQTGPHAVESQRVLNEIATARVTLLNAEKKAAYDATLREKTAPVIRAASSPASDPLEEASSDPDPLAAIITDHSLRPAAPRRRRQWWQNTLAQFSLIGAAAALVVVFAFLIAGRGAKEPADDSRTLQPESRKSIDVARLSASSAPIAESREKKAELEAQQKWQAFLATRQTKDAQAIAKARAEVISAHTKLISIRPSASTYFTRGLTYQDGGDLDKAFDDYTAAIRLEPHIPSLLGRADIYCTKLGRTEDALADYTAAIEKLKGLHLPQFNGAYFMRARLYADKGKIAEAIADYTVIVEEGNVPLNSFFAQASAKLKELRSLAHNGMVRDGNRTTDQLAAQTILECGGRFEIAEPKRMIEKAEELKELPDFFPIRYIDHIGLKRPATDDDLKICSDMRWPERLVSFNIHDGKGVTDKGVEYICRFKNVAHLTLTSTKITEAGFEKLSSLPINYMGVVHWEMTVAGMRQIARTVSLDQLVFVDCSITDDCLKELEGLPHLKCLQIINCPLPTDAALKRLQAFQSIKRVDVSGTTQITDDGVRRFKEARPDVEVTWAR